MTGRVDPLTGNLQPAIRHALTCVTNGASEAITLNLQQPGMGSTVTYLLHLYRYRIVSRELYAPNGLLDLPSSILRINPADPRSALLRQKAESY